MVVNSADFARITTRGARGGNDGAVDHSHGLEASISDEADSLYRPLGFPAPAAVDDAGWAEAVRRLGAVRAQQPEWTAMVDRGMSLAAGYQSGALDGLYPIDWALVMALARGEATLASVGEVALPHVRANVAALRLATDVDVSEESVRRIHGVACGPQLTHPVRVGDHVQDHVLAAGDYKHHPNHRFDHGHWHPAAPVALVDAEMASFVERASADLHPVARATYLHDGLLHIAPFADGNGRVARALAGGCLMRAAAVPFLPAAGGGVYESAMALIDVLTAPPAESPALDRWRVQEAAGDAARARLVTELTEALVRFGQRVDRRADLSAAVVVGDRAIAIRVPAPAVVETILVEAHRDEGDGPVLASAVEAALRTEVGAHVDLARWADRVVATLALRVAAELD